MATVQTTAPIELHMLRSPTATRPTLSTLLRNRRRATHRGLILVLLIAAWGCSTTPPSSDWQNSELQAQRFAQAKNAYLSENYALAASLLRPLAEHGHAQAQYALGYMHYYGLGMTRDETAAIHWLRASAGQGDQQALEALSVLASRAPNKPPPPSPEPMEGATVIRPHQPPTAVENVPAALGDHESTPLDMTNGLSWIRAQNPDHYTLQLLSSSTEEGVKAYLREQAIGAQARYIRTSTPQGERFAVLYGTYASYELAQAAVAALPAPVRAGDPWIRRIGAVLDSLR